MVTLKEKVRPSEAASGSVGLASGIASRWTAGTAMYDAAPQRTENRTYVPRVKSCWITMLKTWATTIPNVANSDRHHDTEDDERTPPRFKSFSFREAVIPISRRNRQSSPWNRSRKSGSSTS